MGYALASYQEYREKARGGAAQGDLATLQMLIDAYEFDFGALPATLADVGTAGKLDPWGAPYVYLAHAGASVGMLRKDRNLVPINTDYDLYSKGPDGRSTPALTAAVSRDDIVRANDGAFLGLAEDY